MNIIIRCPRCGCQNFDIELEYKKRDSYTVRNKKLCLQNRDKQVSLSEIICLICHDCLQTREDEDPAWRPTEEEKKVLNDMLLKIQVADVSEFFVEDDDISPPIPPKPELIKESFF